MIGWNPWPEPRKRKSRLGGINSKSHPTRRIIWSVSAYTAWNRQVCGTRHLKGFKTKKKINGKRGQSMKTMPFACLTRKIMGGTDVYIG